MLSQWSQKATLWLNDEEDNLYVTVHLDLYPPHILLEEAVCGVVLKPSETLTIVLNHVTKLIEQVVDVEAFAYLAVK